MKVDGKAAEPGDEADIGVTGSMSVDSYSNSTKQELVFLLLTVHAQLVSIFTICDDTSIFTGSGGQCDITNSNSSFGTLGLVSDGVGDATSDSIYRYSGETIGSAAIETDTVTITGVGTIRPYDGQQSTLDNFISLFFRLMLPMVDLDLLRHQQLLLVIQQVQWCYRRSNFNY